jgi:hypothetical protein
MYTSSVILARPAGEGNHAARVPIWHAAREVVRYRRPAHL